MALCQCGAELTGKRRKCDGCKGRSTVGRELAAAKGTTDSGASPGRGSNEAPDAIPVGLHERGRALWSALGQDLSTPAGQVALEACRAADRLDELDSVIAGKGVLNLMRFRVGESWWDDDREEHVHVTVGFQSVLAEARQQQANFRALLAEISDVVPVVPASPGPTGPAKSPLDELAERRAAKK
jgi:hypothetical protein